LSYLCGTSTDALGTLSDADIWRGTEHGVAYLLEVPVGDDGRMIVEVDEAEIAPGSTEVAAALDEGLGLAATPGQPVARARQALESMMAGLRPVLTSVAAGLRAAGPDEVTVEFGLNVGGETGIIFAKGTTGVNFTVSMRWKRSEQPDLPASTPPAPAPVPQPDDGAAS
jgi:hypothetical protein